MLAAVAVAAAAAVVVEHAVAELAELAGRPAAELLVAADVLLAVAVFFEPVLVQLVVVPVVPVAPVENVVDEQVKGHPGLHRWLAALLQIVGGSWLDLAYRHFASVVLDDALA